MTIPDAVPPFRFVRGTLPVLLSIPHVGTRIPEALRGDCTHRTACMRSRSSCTNARTWKRACRSTTSLTAARLPPTLTAMVGAAADALAALRP